VKLNLAVSYVIAGPEFENQPSCGILDTLQNTEGGLWHASWQRVAIVESGCVKCMYDPDIDLCAEAAMDLAQTSQMKERRSSNEVSVMFESLSAPRAPMSAVSEFHATEPEKLLGIISPGYI